MNNQWKSDYVHSNGIRIHYTRTGGTGPVVVLAHGFSDNGMCWIRVARSLEKDYDLIMFDTRGHGRSDAPEKGYSFKIQADDIAGLIKVLGLEKPFLMGHSMGAASVAVTTAEYPDLVSAAVLEDPAWMTVREPEDPEGRKRWRNETEKRKQKSLDEIAREGRESSPWWDEIEFGPWAESKKQLSMNVFSWETSDDLSDWRETVKRINRPTLLVTADPEKGAIVTPAVASEVQELCPSIELVRIDKAGHNIRRESFDDFVTAVRSFIEKNV